MRSVPKLVSQCVSAFAIIIPLYLLVSLNYLASKYTLETTNIEDEPEPLLYHLDRIKINQNDSTKGSTHQNISNEITLPRPKIWISMGLCFSHNTEKHGKLHYPYVEITPLALLLWSYFFPNPEQVQVIIYLIYTGPKVSAHMKEYEKTLRPTGAQIEWVPDDGIECVLKSQLIRLFAFGHPLVRPTDIVMTADVNLFLMTDKILDPIFNRPNLLAWIYQYDESAEISLGNGETFNENLIALPARIWRAILEAPSTLTKKWLDEKNKEQELDTKDTWYDDQWITTKSLLRHRICSVPKESGLWKNKGLEHDPDFNDTETCWHGHYYSDCNEDIRIVAEGCKWWHFFPDQTFDDHVKKFNEITNNYYQLDLTSLVRRKR